MDQKWGPLVIALFPPAPRRLAMRSASPSKRQRLSPTRAAAAPAEQPPAERPTAFAAQPNGRHLQVGVRSRGQLLTGVPAPAQQAAPKRTAPTKKPALPPLSPPALPPALPISAWTRARTFFAPRFIAISPTAANTTPASAPLNDNEPEHAMIERLILLTHSFASCFHSQPFGNISTA